MIWLVGRLSLTLAPLRKSPVRETPVWEQRSLLRALFHEQISAAHPLRICWNSCSSPFILCARLSGSRGWLRPAAPGWSRLRIRSRYSAIRVTSPRAPIRLTSRHVPLWGTSRGAPLRPPTSHGAIWSTTRRMRRDRCMLRGLLRNLDCYFGPATRGGWPLRLTSRRSSIWA
jgi:hypothetical protein